MPPADQPSAIRKMKDALRRRIAASGRSVDEVFGVIGALVAGRVAEIRATNAERGSAWPEVQYSDVAAGTVTSDVRELVRRTRMFDRPRSLRS